VPDGELTGMTTHLFAVLKGDSASVTVGACGICLSDRREQLPTVASSTGHVSDRD